jgi:hypothetical protein
MTSPRWWANSNVLVTGNIVAVSASLPSHASTATRNPAGVSQQARGGLRIQTPFLGKPQLAISAAGVGFEVQRGHVAQH